LTTSILRDNPSGLHQEYWYHGGGCRSWLVVTRNTRTHDIQQRHARRGRSREFASLGTAA